MKKSFILKPILLILAFLTLLASCSKETHETEQTSKLTLESFYTLGHPGYCVTCQTTEGDIAVVTPLGSKKFKLFVVNPDLTIQLQKELSFTCLWLTKVIPDYDKGFVIAGTDQDSANQTFFTLIKLDSSGALIWKKDYFPENIDSHLYSICKSNDNNTLMLLSDPGSKLFKFFPSGELSWEKNIWCEGYFPWWQNIMCMEQGEIMITNGGVISGFNSSGQLRWAMGVNSTFCLTSSCILKDGNCALTGQYFSEDSSAFYVYMAKINYAGNNFAADTIKIGYRDYPENICEMPGNGLLVCGKTRGSDNNMKLFVLKTDYQGKQTGLGGMETYKDIRTHGIVAINNGYILCASTFDDKGLYTAFLKKGPI